MQSAQLHRKTPLSWVASKGYIATVTTLLARGADLNATGTKYGEIALSRAAFRGVLLHNGANPNSRDHQNRTPLMLAERNRQSIVSSILSTNQTVSTDTTFTSYPTARSVTGQRYRDDQDENCKHFGCSYFMTEYNFNETGCLKIILERNVNCLEPEGSWIPTGRYRGGWLCFPAIPGIQYYDWSVRERLGQSNKLFRSSWLEWRWKRSRV